MTHDFIVEWQVSINRNAEHKNQVWSGGGVYFSLVDAVREGFRTGFGAKLWI